jgi:hypothetical protein
VCTAAVEATNAGTRPDRPAPGGDERQGFITRRPKTIALAGAAVGAAPGPARGGRHLAPRSPLPTTGPTPAAAQSSEAHSNRRPQRCRPRPAATRPQHASGAPAPPRPRHAAAPRCASPRSRRAPATPSRACAATPRLSGAPPCTVLCTVAAPVLQRQHLLLLPLTSHPSPSNPPPQLVLQRPRLVAHLVPRHQGRRQAGRGGRARGARQPLRAPAGAVGRAGIPHAVGAGAAGGGRGCRDRHSPAPRPSLCRMHVPREPQPSRPFRPPHLFPQSYEVVDFEAGKRLVLSGVSEHHTQLDTFAFMVDRHDPGMTVRRGPGKAGRAAAPPGCGWGRRLTGRRALPPPPGARLMARRPAG